jgi:multiple sugar transport system permease protein
MGRQTAGELRQGLTGYGFAAPYLLLFAVFLAAPIVASLAISFTDFSLGAIDDPADARFVGLQNYRDLASDEKFRAAAVNTAYFVAAGVPLTMAAGLAAAVGLNSQVVRFRALFRVGYYTPVVMSIVAIAVVWRYVLDPDVGLLDNALGAVGLPRVAWLSTPSLAMPSIILIAVWRNLGFAMVIFLAGLQGIPQETSEAARIDGAGRWQEFRHVTLPLLRPTMAFVAVVTSAGYLQLFEEPFVMTGGGPVDRTISVAMHMYEQGFGFFNLGYAGAIAYVLFVAILVTTDQELFTLPVALANFATDPNHPEPGVLMAGSAVLVLPVLAVFLVLQRFFTRGIAMTGLKG